MLSQWTQENVTQITVYFDSLHRIAVKKGIQLVSLLRNENLKNIKATDKANIGRTQGRFPSLQTKK